MHDFHERAFLTTIEEFHRSQSTDLPPQTTPGLLLQGCTFNTLQPVHIQAINSLCTAFVYIACVQLYTYTSLPQAFHHCSRSLHTQFEGLCARCCLNPCFLSLITAPTTAVGLCVCEGLAAEHPTHKLKPALRSLAMLLLTLTLTFTTLPACDRLQGISVPLRGQHLVTHGIYPSQIYVFLYLGH